MQIQLLFISRENQNASRIPVCGIVTRQLLTFIVDFTLSAILFMFRETRFSFMAGCLLWVICWWFFVENQNVFMRFHWHFFLH